ncbi:MAG: family 2 glycosyl transferase [Acidimicrobiaceae bacterium]|nr:MAG: family 2 glycosyl transferase [Acidimicrobiaceae bacterium]
MRGQSFTDWEWCLVDDCSSRPEVLEALDDAARRDSRIKVHHRGANGGIVAASNDALAMATGEFVALLDHDDAIVSSGLASVMAVLQSEAGADVDYIYTDEAHVLADGRESAHFLKPDWSPERFRSSMYTCHLSVLRRAVVEAVGGFRVGFDGSQDHDLILRVTEHAGAADRRVVHVPVLAYHWRNISSSVSRAEGSLPKAVENGRRAVQEQCDRLGLDAEVVHGPVAGCYRLVRRAIERATVSVVVPTRLEGAATRPYRLAVEATIRAITSAPANVRLLVAHPDTAPAELVALLDDLLSETLAPSGAAPERAAPIGWQRVPVPGPWSVAAALDRALLLHPADVLVSVAPGLVPRVDRTPDWLGALVGLALSPGAGLVGALMADRDDTVLHAGWDIPDYRWYELDGLRVGSTTSGNDLLIERECSQVTLAAAAVSGAQWRECASTAAGGFHDAGRALSQALVQRGARTLWTPYARFDQSTAIDL